MKKLIAILVVFALVAGSIFAADVGVDVFGMFNLAKGSSAKNAAGDTADADANMAIPRIRISASAQDENGIFGGWARFDTPNNWGAGGNTYGEGMVAYGYAWWQPIEQVKLQIGTNGGDGEFGLEGVTTWGFYQVAGDVRTIGADNAWGSGFWNGAGFRSAFYGGFNDGVVLKILPMDALAINIGIPFTYSWGTKAGDTYRSSHVQVAYNADGIGTFGLTFVGDIMDKDVIGDSAKLYIFAGLSMIEGLGIDVGLGIKFPETDTTGPVDVTVSYPISAGLGLNFGADQFGVKARFMGQFAGSVKVDSDKTDMPFLMLADILPYYNVSDTVTVLLSAGLKLYGEDKDGVMGTPGVKTESVTGWHIHPYVTIKSNWWAPNFYAGFRLESDGGEDGKGDKYVDWSIPIGIAFSF